MIGALSRPEAAGVGMAALPGKNTGRLRSSLPLLAACALAMGALLLAAISAAYAPLHSFGLVNAGPFWGIPGAWVGVGALAALALLVENRAVRTLSALLFGAGTMGLLGYVEPFGVFHDSWRNVGLGQMMLSPELSGAAFSDPYVSGSPGAFIVLGLLRAAFPDTASMLRVYPLLSALVYSAAIYTMALAYGDAHFSGFANGLRNAPYRMRFPLLAVVAFLSVAAIFSVRINPAPQSVAFAMLPFFLAAILRGKQGARYRLLALGLFGAIVLTHAITALMAAVICGAYFLSDLPLRARARPVVRLNTVAVYGCLFLTWLIYVGVWVVRAGSGFVERMLSILDSGQRATVSAGGDYAIWDFIWVHRVAMGGAALLILGGLIVAWKADRATGMRLLAWFGVSAAWTPLMFLGEFADRGPLFASLPASIAIAFLLNMRCMSRPMRGRSNKVKSVKTLVWITMLLTAVTGFATSYSNHVGEVITAPELQAFQAIAARVPDGKIAYGYVPPLTGDDLPVYLSDRVRAYALGAADFSYDRLLRQSGVIAVSEGMRQATRLRGGRQSAAYERFLGQLNDASRYELVYSNDFVRAYRAR